MNNIPAEKASEILREIFKQKYRKDKVLLQLIKQHKSKNIVFKCRKQLIEELHNRFIFCCILKLNLLKH